MSDGQRGLQLLAPGLERRVVGVQRGPPARPVVARGRWSSSATTVPRVGLARQRG